jgi:hypothetical protein
MSGRRQVDVENLTTATGLVLSRKTTQLSKRKDETSILLQGDDQIGGNGTRYFRIE